MAPSWHEILRAVICLMLICCLISCGQTPKYDIDALKPMAASAVRDKGIHDITPLRGERGPLRLHQDGDVYECSMCHDGFEGDLGEEALQGAHAAITFDHGRNVFCLNCHHPKNSDAYDNFRDEEIPGDQPTQLCAKCHGLHYREWRQDIHGRVNLYWDKKYGEQVKLDCIQCHDPHRPKIPSMKPEPPPVLTRFDRNAPKGSPHD